jgi:hypothetical protein
MRIIFYFQIKMDENLEQNFISYLNLDDESNYVDLKYVKELSSEDSAVRSRGLQTLISMIEKQQFGKSY